MQVISKDIKRILVRQHYKLVGNHSAVKLCHWLKKSLLDKNFCYKQKFYGICSHRCMQFTPAVVFCSQKCLFCWRDTEYTLKYKKENFDEPEFIFEEAIKAQRSLLSGYGGIPDRVNMKKLKEAQNPTNVAISLSGEPTIYPKISELIEIFHRKNFTTFLVTNGTFPEVLERMKMPTQLYISLVAPTEEYYRRICNPLILDGWEKFNTSLELFPSLETKKVVRLTLVKGLNDILPKEYAKLIEKAEPDFLEVKSYMFLGGSRKRLSLENMPSFEECKNFAEKINEFLNYNFKDEKKDSRVVLLSKK
ncbi:MAG: 4-demethylwyosine synthase TYW1 [Candidatus Altiarchaeota archaeon]